MKSIKLTIAALAAAVAAPATADTWDMPMAYSASNFHSAVGAEFAQCVTTGTVKLTRCARRRSLEAIFAAWNDRRNCNSFGSRSYK